MDKIREGLIEIMCWNCIVINKGECSHRYADHCSHRDRHIKAILSKYHVIPKDQAVYNEKEVLGKKVKSIIYVEDK